jgi:hypothetical protein
MILFKNVGKVAGLRNQLETGIPTPSPFDEEKSVDPNAQKPKTDMTRVFLSQTSMAHTRWATHGVPAPSNCHPHVSDAMTEFSVVHSTSLLPKHAVPRWPVADRSSSIRRYHHELWVIRIMSTSDLIGRE